MYRYVLASGLTTQVKSSIIKKQVNRTSEVSDILFKNDSVKREAGEIPARTRRCNEGALFYVPLATAEKAE